MTAPDSHTPTGGNLQPSAVTIAARRLANARVELMSAMRQLDRPGTRWAQAAVAAAVSNLDDALAKLAGEQS